MNKEKFIKMVNAFSDTTRLKILSLIVKRGEISCLEITKKVKMSQPTISHHLKILADSGLVNVRRAGKYGFFSINVKAINKLSKEITNLLKQGGKLWKNG